MVSLAVKFYWTVSGRNTDCKDVRCMQLQWYHTINLHLPAPLFTMFRLEDFLHQMPFSSETGHLLFVAQMCLNDYTMDPPGNDVIWYEIIWLYKQ